MPDLRELVEPLLDSPVSAAALYRVKRTQHAYPIVVHGGVLLSGLVEGLVKLLVRRDRERRGTVQSPDSRPSVVPHTASVLLGVGGDRLAVVVVRSRLKGWIVKSRVGTFSKSAIQCIPIDADPFGMELVFPSGEVLRLRPMYQAPDVKEIAGVLVQRAN